MTISASRRAVLIVCLAAPRVARSQGSFPGSRPVSLVIPYAPGGIPDVFGSAINQGFAERLGGTFVMDHRPGASTTLGARQVARARPDGYTLLFGGIGTFTLTPLVLRNAGYDPLTDFTPIGMSGSALYLFVANPRWMSLEAILRAARQQPNGISYASWGVGSSAHLGTVDLAQRARVEMVHVPYNGTAAALTDIAAGRVDFMISTLAPARPHLDGGRIRAIGVCTARRFRMLPNVPTVGEQGFTDYTLDNWTAVVGPAGLRDDIAGALEAALAETFASEALLARLEPLGITGAPTGARALREQIPRDLAQHRELVQRAGITPV
ncbi:MAG TPA: tripartite tricarboxylate transporter substrate binding protein [Acetobacteraceae bacterium]|nr:tripartite tricarboxylate transporter substrate binding protein [Acetobacteraceae bacterium]